jgi:hypothetical protein
MTHSKYLKKLEISLDEDVLHNKKAELNKQLARAQAKVISIDNHFIQLQEQIDAHQNMLGTLTGTEVSTKPFWEKTIEGYNSNQLIQFIYGQEFDSDHKTRLPIILKIKLSSSLKNHPLDRFAQTTSYIYNESQKMAYNVSGYSEAQYEEDEWQSHINSGSDASPSRTIFWNPLSHILSFGSIAVAPACGILAVISTSVVDGIKSSKNTLSSTKEKSIYGKFTKVTLGNRTLTMDVLQWDSDKSKQFQRMLNAKNDSLEQFNCTIEAQSPSNNWNTRDFTVKIYTDKRAQLRFELTEYKQNKVKLNQERQFYKDEITEIETAISLLQKREEKKASTSTGYRTNTKHGVFNTAKGINSTLFSGNQTTPSMNPSPQGLSIKRNDPITPMSHRTQTVRKEQVNGFFKNNENLGNTSGSAFSRLTNS